MPHNTSELSLSIIIPAHNERECISPLLEELVRLQDLYKSVEVIVVCNGCSDDSAVYIAKHFPSINVLETTVASKVNALNIGDAEAQHFPRLYIDADVMISAQDIAVLCTEMHRSKALAASPQIHFNTKGASCVVKAYYRSAIWSDYNQQDLLSNVIALTQSGHERLGKFPDVMADDEYLRRLFCREERLLAKNCSYQFYTPKNLLGLIKILTRARLGNLHLQAFLESTDNPQNTPTETKHCEGQYSRMFKKAGLLSFSVFLGVKVVSFIRSTYQFKRASTQWERDESSRKR